MRGSLIKIKNALTIAGGIAPGSAIHQEMRVWVRILALFKKKDNRETPVSHVSVARPP